MAFKILWIQKNIGFFLQGLFAVFIAVIEMSTGVDIRLLWVNKGIRYENNAKKSFISEFV